MRWLVFSLHLRKSVTPAASNLFEAKLIGWFSCFYDGGRFTLSLRHIVYVWDVNNRAVCAVGKPDFWGSGFELNSGVLESILLAYSQNLPCCLLATSSSVTDSSFKTWTCCNTGDSHWLDAVNYFHIIIMQPCCSSLMGLNFMLQLFQKHFLSTILPQVLYK